jgi:FkbM family methyltransferase
VLAPLLNERAYRLIQAVSIARDIRAETFTEPELGIGLAALRPDDVAIDLGANYGMYAIPMARRVGPGGRIYAFEPVPFTADTLRTVRSLLRAGNVDIREKACGQEHGTITFSVPLQASGAISAGQAHAAGRNDRRPGRDQHVRWERSRDVTCEVVALDEELEGVGETALIKADIEGMELFAFRGARRIIERDLPVVISEINPWFLDGFEIALDELVGFFTSLGYDFYKCDDASGRLYPVGALEDVVEDNYVFVHPRRADRLAALIG